MHGTEHRKPERGAFRRSAPRYLLSTDTGSMLSGALQPSPVRDRMLVTAFCSPATTHAFADTIPGSKLPTCHFASWRPGRLPVRPFGSTTETGLPQFRRLRCFRPVAALPTHLADCASSLHSPSGLLPPSGSKRSAGFAACRPAFRIRPISSRSPQPFSIASVSVADHRSWSATFPEARCSSNLLEPFPLCSRSV